MTTGRDKIFLGYKAGLLVAAITLMVAMGLTVELAWRIAPFKTTRILFCSELLKLMIAVCFSCTESGETKVSASPFLTVRYWGKKMLFAVPAFLYFLTNNTAYLAQKYLSVHLVTLMANMKVIIAASFAYSAMGQRFTSMQIVALCITFLGLVVLNLNPGQKHGSTHELTISKILLTVAYGLVTSTLSSIAGVLCEYLYKRRPYGRKMSFHRQSVHIYAFGVFFNILGMCLQGSSGISNDGDSETVFFHWSHALMICLSASSGILMGAIMKYLDNVVRNLAVCVGTIILTLMSWLMFHNPLTIQFVVGGTLVLSSVILYRISSPPEKMQLKEE